jgi:DHA2 family multidrug resistance protein-like MFS transporter
VASIAATPFLVRRLHPVTIIVGGMIITGAGAWLFTTVGPSGPATPVLVGLAAATFGNSPVVGIGTTLILGSLPEEKAGAAAAIGQTSNELGFASGVAVLGSVAALVYRTRLDLPTGLPRAVASRAGTGLAQALQTGSPVAIHAARDAYLHGLHAVGWLVVATAASVAVLSGMFLRGRSAVAAVPGPPAARMSNSGPTEGAGDQSDDPPAVALSPGSGAARGSRHARNAAST